MVMMLPRELEARAQQNRQNASHSTGPVTENGKRAVSFNSTKHNLTSSGIDRAALPGEESQFDRFCRELRAELAPVGPTETALADDICADRWRLRRARQMEQALFAEIERESGDPAGPAAAKAKAWIDSSKGLQRLALYANRLQRAIEKGAAALEARQAHRKAAEAKALEEAILLTQYSELEGKTYEPGNDFLPSCAHGGFVYSRDEIVSRISRKRRLEEAKSLFAPEVAKAA
jgi:hypothetical protein